MKEEGYFWCIQKYHEQHSFTGEDSLCGGKLNSKLVHYKDNTVMWEE